MWRRAAFDATWNEDGDAAKQADGPRAAEKADSSSSGPSATSYALSVQPVLLLGGGGSAGAGADASAVGSAAPPLRAICLGLLGRHVTEVVSQLGPHLTALPADVKACLLCVARRRGVLTNRVLLSLVDDAWPLLDLAGAAALTERAVRQALLRCSGLRCLDLRRTAAGGSTALLRQLPDLCPRLEVLALGEGRDGGGGCGGSSSSGGGAGGGARIGGTVGKAGLSAAEEAALEG